MRRAGKYLTFRLAGESYGIEILTVQELIGLQGITRIPRAPDFMRGVINLRGRIIPVVDPRRKLGLDPLKTTEQTVIIVVRSAWRGGELTMGVLVDEVLEVRDIDAGQIEPPPGLGTGAFDATFILGVAKCDARVVFLVDIVKVLTPAEVAAAAETVPAAAQA